MGNPASTADSLVFRRRGRVSVRLYSVRVKGWKLSKTKQWASQTSKKLSARRRSERKLPNGDSAV